MSKDLVLNGKYVTTRHGVTTTVELIKIKRDTVYLREPERVDSFKLSLNKFKEYYKAV